MTRRKRSHTRRPLSSKRELKTASRCQKHHRCRGGPSVATVSPSHSNCRDTESKVTQVKSTEVGSAATEGHCAQSSGLSREAQVNRAPPLRRHSGTMAPLTDAMNLQAPTRSDSGRRLRQASSFASNSGAGSHGARKPQPCNDLHEVHVQHLNAYRAHSDSTAQLVTSKSGTKCERIAGEETTVALAESGPFPLAEMPRLRVTDIAACAAFFLFAVVLVGFWTIYSVAETNALLIRSAEARVAATTDQTDAPSGINSNHGGAPKVTDFEQGHVEPQPQDTEEYGSSMASQEFARKNEEAIEDYTTFERPSATEDLD